MTTKILLTSKMMAISLIVYCVCEEKVVNISYSHKHWRDIKQGAHNDRTFLHHVKGSSQSYTMLNGQTFLLLYLGHLIVNFPYSYFYFRPPSPAFHTYPPFLRIYPSKHQPCPLLNNIKASDEYLTSPVHTTHSFLCARHSLQTQCSFEPFAHPLGLNLWSVCHYTKSAKSYLTSVTTYVCQTTILNKLNSFHCEYVFEAVLSWWSYYPQHNKPIFPNAWWSTLATLKNHSSDVDYLLKGSLSGFVVKKTNFLDPLCLSCCTFSLKSRTSQPTFLSTKES